MALVNSDHHLPYIRQAPFKPMSNQLARAQGCRSSQGNMCLKLCKLTNLNAEKHGNAPDYCYAFQLLKMVQIVFLTQSVGKEHSCSSKNSQSLILLPTFFLRGNDAQTSCVTTSSQVSYDCG